MGSRLKTGGRRREPPGLILLGLARNFGQLTECPRNVQHGDLHGLFKASGQAGAESCSDILQTDNCRWRRSSEPHYPEPIHAPLQCEDLPPTTPKRFSQSASL